MVGRSLIITVGAFVYTLPYIRTSLTATMLPPLMNRFDFLRGETTIISLFDSSYIFVWFTMKISFTV